MLSLILFPAVSVCNIDSNLSLVVGEDKKLFYTLLETKEKERGTISQVVKEIPRKN